MTEAHNDSTREKIRDGIDNTRDAAREAARQTAQTIDSNPMGVLVGGLALGALIGAIIPRTQREKTLLAPVGKRILTSTTAAIAAAKAAGKEELDGLGLTPTAAKGQAKSLFDGVLKAASSAGNAAAQAGKDAAKAR